jgi:lipoprotein-anchoring transpeptidase ErfK/SrfK
MRMARNESVARMVMLLCFGTALLSLVVHWQIMKQGQLAQPASTVWRKNSVKNYSTGNLPEDVYRRTTSIGIGETALGAFVPSDPQKPSVVKSPPLKEIKTKNLASNTTNTPKKTWLVSPMMGNNLNVPAPLKSSSETASANTQVVVVLSDRRAYVYRDNEVIASYPIAVGKKGWETPTGNFQVIHMQHHPIWRHPITGKVFEAGTDSPLGDRWVGFWSDGRNEIGFHGTPDTDLIGTAVSHGCLRMRNADVRSLYNKVSLGTPVLVRN